MWGMPVYEYRCDEGHEFEIQQKITDPPLEECQEEGCEAPVQKQISKTSFILKGGGWFRDGYSKRD